MKRLALFFLGNLIFSGLVFSQDTFEKPPSWAKGAIWYQIMVERFSNGDTTNDPTPSTIAIPPIGLVPPGDWAVTPWGWNWFKQEPWAVQTGKDINYTNQLRRFGGDLQGVIEKLDYLKDLGINALFLNPINDAPSLHKYDARNYHHVDINFGPDPEGDRARIAKENPSDPATWCYTQADSLFLELVRQAHARGMKVILDYSWNHTGVMFWAWQDILKNQERSPYKDWYAVNAFDDRSTPENEFSYIGWANVNSLPEVRKVDVVPPRVAGNPYEGDINSGMKKHIFDVTRRWLAPNGDTANGIDGFRLDVADQIGMKFWRDYRKFVRSIKPDAYLVGEIWWKQWPDQLMDPAPYTRGDIFDAVMFYQVYKPARYFFANTDSSIDAKQFRQSLEFEWNRIKPKNLHAMMNVSSSHDAPRLLTSFGNRNAYKYKCTPRDDPHYKTGKPDEESYQRLRLYLVHLFTTVGAPHVWNGEELGMWGADDPDCRKPLWWSGMAFNDEYRYNYQPGESALDVVAYNQDQFSWYKKLIKLRRDNPVLVDGTLSFLVADGKRLAYLRKDESKEIIVVFNLESESQDFPLSFPGTWKDLLTDKVIHNVQTLTVAPMTAMVLTRGER